MTKSINFSSTKSIEKAFSLQAAPTVMKSWIALEIQYSTAIEKRFSLKGIEMTILFI